MEKLVSQPQLAGWKLGITNTERFSCARAAASVAAARNERRGIQRERGMARVLSIGGNQDAHQRPVERAPVRCGGQPNLNMCCGEPTPGQTKVCVVLGPAQSVFEWPQERMTVVQANASSQSSGIASEAER